MASIMRGMVNFPGKLNLVIAYAPNPAIIITKKETVVEIMMEFFR